MSNPWERDWDKPLAANPWERNWKEPPPAKQAKPKVEVGGAGQAALVAAGRGFDRLASGLREATPAPIRGALDKVDSWFGVTPPSIDKATLDNATAEFEKVEGKHPVAAFAGGMAPYGAVTNPISMGIMGAMEPGSLAERAGKGVLSWGSGKLGNMAGEKIAGKLASRAESKTADLAAQQARNAPFDETARAARDAGYSLSLAQTNPTVANRALEGLSGKIATQQALAIKNEAVTQNLAKRALSLPEDVPLSREAIGTVRSAAGEVYKAVKNFGRVEADEPFHAARTALFNDYNQLVAEFPSQSNAQIQALMKDLSRDNFSANTMVEFVKRLRHDGFANIVAMEPEKKALGRVQVQAQNVLEDLLERRLEAAGDPGALDVFRKARALIAKSYTVEKALEESTGKVVASKIGREFSKGKPLTGELATIGRTAEAFPKALQNVNTAMPGVSPLDYVTALLGGAATGNAAVGALPLMRPFVRAGITSDAAQKALGARGYDMGALDKLLAKAGENPETLKKFGGLLGLSGQRAYQ